MHTRNVRKIEKVNSETSRGKETSVETRKWSKGELCTHRRNSKVLGLFPVSNAKKLINLEWWKWNNCFDKSKREFHSFIHKKDDIEWHKSLSPSGNVMSNTAFYGNSRFLNKFSFVLDHFGPVADVRGGGLGGSSTPPPEPEKIVVEKWCYFRRFYF